MSVRKTDTTGKNAAAQPVIYTKVSGIYDTFHGELSVAELQISFVHDDSGDFPCVIDFVDEYNARLKPYKFIVERGTLIIR